VSTATLLLLDGQGRVSTTSSRSLVATEQDLRELRVQFQTLPGEAVQNQETTQQESCELTILKRVVVGDGQPARAETTPPEPSSTQHQQELDR
jgi:hypothetical protein